MGQTFSKAQTSSRNNPQTNLHNDDDNEIVTTKTLTQPTNAKNVSFLNGMATLVVDEIFSWLAPANRLSFFKVLSRIKDPKDAKGPAYVQVREGAINGIQHQFLQHIADAELREANEILKQAIFNKDMLRKLLTTNKTITQRNGMIVTGSALEIAIKCWDWSCCVGGRGEMAEMLMFYMQKLPGGEALIAARMNQLFPKGIDANNGKEIDGYEAHKRKQISDAARFTNHILEPLAQIIKVANVADIDHVYELTNKESKEFDDYINVTLTGSPLWAELMKHADIIKTWMQNDVIYNPHYLSSAMEKVNEKDEKEKWVNLDGGQGWKRLALLSIHGIGDIQECSPRIVKMLFARGGIDDFCNMNEKKGKTFKVKRDCQFKKIYNEGSIEGRSPDGISLLGKKYWALWVGRSFRVPLGLELMCRSASAVVFCISSKNRIPGNTMSAAYFAISVITNTIRSALMQTSPTSQSTNSTDTQTNQHNDDGDNATIAKIITRP